MADLFYSLEPGAKRPDRASRDAAGYDVYAHHDAVIEPGRTLLVSTGVRLAIPQGYEAQVRPRSGLSLRTGLRIANSPGTIDADYRGLVSVICQNTNPLSTYEYLLAHPELGEHFSRDYQRISFWEYFKTREGVVLPKGLPDDFLYVDREGFPLGTIFIRAGERIAQLVFSRLAFLEFVEADDVSLIGHDRGGGFGSTGKL